MARQKLMHLKQRPATRRLSRRGVGMSLAHKYKMRENANLHVQVASLQEKLAELTDLVREDQELNAIADERSSGPFVRVSLDEL